MENPNRVLVSEDTDLWQGILARFLAGAVFELHQARDLAGTIAELQRYYFNAVIVDLALDPIDEYRLDGIETMRTIRTLNEGTQAIVLTGKGTVELAVAALRDFQVFHFLQKEKIDRPEDLLPVVEEACTRAYRLVRGPGALPPLETFLEPMDWHRLSSKIQVRQNDLKDVFSGLVRSCMPIRFRGKRLKPDFEAEHLFTAELWSKWFGKAVRIMVGKRGDSAVSPTGKELHSYHLDTAAGLVVPVDAPFEGFL